ncbi:MAG: protein kinase [Planctomycetes bacterium]|nr:protein kinase [Planctomycetota bacterium]
MSEATPKFDSTVRRDAETLVPVGAAEFAVPPRYRLVRQIGRGGFGVVWLARDEDLQRPVALKFLTDARPADVERFRREARFAARLADPAFVQVYELGEAGGRPFIAMQFVDGASLAEVRLGRAEALRVIATVARALGQAHAGGIVHRDLKPQNLLVDKEGRAYVTDFGIARDLRATEGMTLTADGAVVGTPSYLPPEQARGDARAVDGRSDVYSLGATLYFLLTGRPPVQGENLLEVLHAVVHAEPPPPRTLDPSISVELEAIVLKCLRKRPADRYDGMPALAEDLERVLAGQPVAAAAPPASPSRATAAATAASTPRTDVGGGDPYLAEVLEAARDIADWDAGLYRVSSNICRTYPRLDAVVARLDRILASRPDHAMARFYRGLALFRRERLALALEEMERVIGRLGDMATAHFELGRLYLALYLRDARHAHQHLSRSGVGDHLADARGRLDQALLSFQEAQRGKADLTLWQLDFARAIERLADGDVEGCVAACDAILERDPDIEEVWRTRGDALRLAGKDPIASYDHALQVRRSYHEALAAKAETHLARGAHAEAREALGQALSVCPESVEAMVLGARVELAEARRAAPAGGAREHGSEHDADPEAGGHHGHEDSHGGGPAGMGWERELTGEAVRRLEAALARLAAARAIEPEHYEATVLQADVLTALGRLPGRGGRVDEALELLRPARKLEGCQNRVMFLTARARLVRARLQAAAGLDPRPDLDVVLGYRDEAAASAPDNEGWLEVLDAAQAERERLGGGPAR